MCLRVHNYYNLGQDENISNELEQDQGYNNPEEFFNEGVIAGQELGESQTQERLADQLIDEGFDPDEVNELLYDPAPRSHKGYRKGKRSCSAKQWAKMPQICKGSKTSSHHSRYADPAPRRGRKGVSRRYDPAPYSTTARKYGKKAKGMLTKLRPIVMPAAAGLTFYTAYTTRAKALFATAKIPKDSVYEAIKYDLSYLDANAAVDRLQAKASGIITPAIIGTILKYGKQYVDPKLRAPMDVTGDALIGMAIGTGFKILLDPPIQNSPPCPQAQAQTQAQVQAQIQAAQIEAINMNMNMQPQIIDAQFIPYRSG